ncbi:uncharacterized protein KY384_000407 [Bacidia gigantensis]|uniref:uncharacterized protein n=1 Tax=Bacidia gigantensis TaxID=2732470 RepID=UPI001D059779|nr:uncharacterized protein KY384_000407 [Bacidia gigantensis]KAG8525647.1 hypothetical protein KY384_000407 [Bacidia gigantensis]
MADDDGFDIIPDTAPVKFDSAEHADIPAECQLRLTTDRSLAVSCNSQAAILVSVPWTGYGVITHAINWAKSNLGYLSNSKVDLNFAKIIALAGDFYVNDDVTQPISYGADMAERKARFGAAVKNLVTDYYGTLPYLDKYLSDEGYMIEKILGDLPLEVPDLDPNKPPGEIIPPKKPDGTDWTDKEREEAENAAMYQKVENKGPNRIVQNYIAQVDGVDTNANTLWQVGVFQYGNILLYNMDHFGDMAWDVYRAGHSMALDLAKQGYASRNANKPEEASDKLKAAYVYDSFALHYLSDQFASGHTRTPRMELNRPSRMQFVLARDKVGLHTETPNTFSRQIVSTGSEGLYMYHETPFTNTSNSVECVQTSINEVYEAWMTGKAPDDPEKFAALDQVPVPDITHGIDENLESSGNTMNLWVVFRNPYHPNAKQRNIDGSWDYLDLKSFLNYQEIKNPRVSGKQKYSDNGYYWARRQDLEDCCGSQYQWGDPGQQGIYASQDVLDVENSKFKKDDLTRPEGRPVEILAGGFIQVQEYGIDGGKVNYGVNVWGPIQTPINYRPLSFDPTYKPVADVTKPAAADGTKAALAPADPTVNTFAKQKEKQAAVQQEAGNKYYTDNRQMTFTFRGRRTDLSQDPETIKDNKTLRWHSWWDPAGSGKTSLLKFSFSENSPDASKSNAILVESWSFTDSDKKTDQQWTQWEKMKNQPPLEFGGTDKKKSEYDIKRTVLVSSFKSDDWKLYGPLTRFFIFPFRQGSGSSNPDLITWTWKAGGTPGSLVPFVSVASTDKLLLNPQIKITSGAEDVVQLSGKSSTVAPPASGFIKRFEDVNNKPMLLFASGTDKIEGGAGVLVAPQLFEQDGSSDKIKVTKTDKVQLPMKTSPTDDAFFQVLTGDTRYAFRVWPKKLLTLSYRRTGHREMVVMSGAWPEFYLSAWELTADRKWTNTSGPSTGPIPYMSKWKLLAPPKAPTTPDGVRHLFCALMPNEPTRNGSNVVLVSSYTVKNLIPPAKNAGKNDPPKYSYINVINFRTFIKDGKQAPNQIAAQSPANNPPSKQAPPQSSTVPSEPMTETTWYGSNTSTKVPTRFFIPPDSIQKSFTGEVKTSGSVKPGTIVPLPAPFYAPSCPSRLCLYKRPYDNRYGDFNGLSAIAASLSGRKPMQQEVELRPRPGTTGDWDVWDKGRNVRETDSSRDIVVKNPWYENINTEFYYDTVLKKPIALMTFPLIQPDAYVSVVTNPDVLFAWSANGGKLPDPATTPTPGITPPGMPNMPIQTAPTVTPPAPSQPRDPAGWSSYVDCVVNEDFEYLQDDKKKHTTTKNIHFNSMGWRMCKVGSTVRGIPMYGIMNVTSFHGVIGCRVYAPAEPGRYENWVCRGLNPYLGQTSLGKCSVPCSMWAMLGLVEDYTFVNGD